ncbi:MAG: LodA/GoxA family CTQ-dependent oxidase [Bacteroidota bacterium]
MAKKKYKIHPAIGIARLGDSDNYFIGPEMADEGWNRPYPTAPKTFKDKGKIRPQAARFRIFEYVLKGGKYVVNREINIKQKDVDVIKWKVHLANKKGAFFKFDGLRGSKSVTPRVGYQSEKSGRRNGATKKSIRDMFTIDPKARWIDAKYNKVIEIKKTTRPVNQKWPATTPQINSIGRIATDSDGNLLVIGARGVSGRISGAKDISNYANNDGWFDDVADGAVSVYLKFKGQNQVKVEMAWVITAPPDFAPHISNVVSLYDVLFDLTARNPALIPKDELQYFTGELKTLKEISDEFVRNGKYKLRKYTPDFDTEIFPILKATIDTAFVFGPAANSHSGLRLNLLKDLGDPSKPKRAREMIFNFLRSPDQSVKSAFPNMPKLLGDEPYYLKSLKAYHPRVRVTVTPTQYALLEQWKNGRFKKTNGAFGNRVSLPRITPHGLDKAALMNCVGAAMYPGIEVGWQIREASIFSEPFRIKMDAIDPYVSLPNRAKRIQPGHFTRQMALPWQADFLECKSEEGEGIFSGKWGWWPAQRPDEVFKSVADFKASPKKNVQWTRATRHGSIIDWPTGYELKAGSHDKTRPSFMEMISHWKKFGFVVKDKANPGYYIEKEREPNVP